MSPTPPPYPLYKLALLGFGNVGQALAELLLEKETDLIKDPGLGFLVVGIASGSHGKAINPRGLPVQQVLEAYREGRSLDEFSSFPITNNQEFIEKCGADALVEASPVNYQTGQPALDYLRQALAAGKHAITANKGPVVYAYRELTDLAKRKGVSFYFESTVMDGAPVFSIARSGLPGALVSKFSGILNSTTNLILTRMEEGETQDEAILYAQSIGIAETDPSGDVDGWDAAVKVAALVTVLMDIPLTPEQVERNGIRGITPDMIQDARENNQRWKLVCIAKRNPDNLQGVTAAVQPQLVSPSSHLYNVSGTSAILEISSDVLGKLSLIEENPSPRTTAYGILADLLNAFKDRFPTIRY
ncbi:MAG: homoserine dehydrogenase [Anaerolineales bacterium]|nr:MAG: homoserine dehydrogenase [Anaerolineales bacterium]